MVFKQEKKVFDVYGEDDWQNSSDNTGMQNFFPVMLKMHHALDGQLRLMNTK